MNDKPKKDEMWNQCFHVPQKVEVVEVVLLPPKVFLRKSCQLSSLSIKPRLWINACELVARRAISSLRKLLHASSTTTKHFLCFRNSQSFLPSLASPISFVSFFFFFTGRHDTNNIPCWRWTHRWHLQHHGLPLWSAPPTAWFFHRTCILNPHPSGRGRIHFSSFCSSFTWPSTSPNREASHATKLLNFSRKNVTLLSAISFCHNSSLSGC